MKAFIEWLEHFFAKSGEMEGSLSEHWRAHANRRTILIVIIFGIAAIWLYISVIQPPDNFPTGQLVTISAGEPVKDIGTMLKEDGVIRNALAFRLIVTVMGREHGVYAGDYLFKQPEDIFSIARALSIGAYGLEPLRIRVPEGATTKQMSIIFGIQLQRLNTANFFAQAQPMEGYLFPDTYFFLPNATEATVIQAMRQNFDSQIAPLLPAIATSTHSLSDIVTMASIVEKEASKPDDRRMIAGVLWNRIARGMPLQSDVTLLYVVNKPDSQLTTADLANASPYNTYVHKGLPPGPIDSPSLSSLLAALNPIKNDYLYYLADKNGITHYAKTYQQHLINKAKYLGT